MNNLQAVQLLSNAMWVMIAMAHIMSYGGLHPTDASINFLFFYVAVIVFLLNLPLLYYLLSHLTTFQPKEQLLVEIVLYFVKLAIAAYFLGLF